MKRSILTFLVFFLAVSCFADNVVKQYKKLINNYDVADEAKSVMFNSPNAFWSATLDNNELLIKFTKDLKTNRGAEKEALQKFAQIPRFYPQYDESIIESMQGWCDTLLIDMGIADLHMNCTLHIVYSDEANAFTTLTENGFAMCLTTGLLGKKGINYLILMGYVAHEFVHGALFHHLRSCYANAKERRKNELLGGIAAGLNVLAAGVEAYNTNAYGIPPSGTNYGAQIERIGDEVTTATLKHSFKFSREQEYEADLIAYRFLENMGNGKEYLDGLRILGTEYDVLYNEYSDHPTISSRIEFLKYVKSNPLFGNTINKKLRKKKSYMDDIYDL